MGRARLIAEWAGAALGVALVCSLLLEWAPDETGWEFLTHGDLAVCAAGVAAVAYWLRACELLATVAPVAAAGAVFVVLDARGNGAGAGADVALGCAAGLAVATVVATGFLRLRPRDWRLDAAAAALLVWTWLPWMARPAGGFLGWEDDGRDNAWEWFGEVDQLIALAVTAAVAASHAPGPLGDRAIAARAAAVTLVAVLGSLGRSLATADDHGWEIELRYGAYAGVATLLLMLGIALTRPARAPAPTRRAP